MTPNELAAELKRLHHKGWIKVMQWPSEVAEAREDFLDLVLDNLPALTAALDRAAGPVEWTEGDERRLSAIYAKDAAYIAGNPDSRWLASKLSAFVASQKGAGR